MYMGDNIFITTANAILTASMWKMIFVFIIAFVTGSIAKSVATNIYEYIMIKTDIFGIGSIVEFGGKRGVIRSMGFRRIAIDITEKGKKRETMYINSCDWRKIHLIVPHYEDML